MKIPVVLPVVHVRVDEAGLLKIDVDGQCYADNRALRRHDLHTALDEITSERQSPVRVEVVECDGSAYADIATPAAEPRDEASRRAPTAAPSMPSMPGVSASGFHPGEHVALAYVLVHATADDAGNAVVHLPPSAMSGRHSVMVFLGLDSRATALVKAHT